MWVGMRLNRERRKKKRKEKEAGVLDKVSNVQGHFLHGCIVEGLDVAEGTLVIFCDHVDSDTLSAKTATTSNSTQIKHCYYTTARIAQIRQKAQKELC